MYFIYSVLAALALLLSSPWWLLRMLTSGKYRAGLSERLGKFPARLQFQARRGQGIWIHAVSVGEVLAVSGLIHELREIYPDHRVVVSTTTEAGHLLARSRYGPENVFYFPIDLGFAIRPYLRRLRPKLVIMAETEFWPNFIHLARKNGAKIAVVNARISDRSLPGYRRWRGLLVNVLKDIDVFMAQSEQDRERLIAIGAVPERVEVSGNLKFDVKPRQEAAIVAELEAAIKVQAAQPVLVFGSTVDGEEPALLAAFTGVLREFPKSLLVLAPRRPERFDEVFTLVRNEGLRCLRRSAWEGGGVPGNQTTKSEVKVKLAGSVLLLDSIGELASIYRLADVALVGGSFEARGGHNILEPARFGAPVVVGPHMENFRDIMSAFAESSAAVQLASGGAKEIERCLLDLLRDPDKRKSMGAAALEVLRRRQGATELTLHALKLLLEGTR